MASKTPDSGKGAAKADGQAEGGFPPLPHGKGPQLAAQPRITRSRAGQETSKDKSANDGQDLDMRVRKTKIETRNKTKRRQNRTKNSGKKEREYEWYPDSEITMIIKQEKEDQDFPGSDPDFDDIRIIDEKQ